QLEPVPSHAHENRYPARTDRRNGGVDGTGVAGGIDVAVEMLFELCKVRLHRVDGAARAMCLGESTAVLHRVADHDLRGAIGAGDLGIEHSDRAGTGDEHPRPLGDLRLAHGMDGDRNRLGHRSLFEAHRLRDLVGEVVVDDLVLRERAVHGPGAIELHGAAQMVGAALAVVAAPTDSLRFDGDARPDAGGGDIRSPGDDGARGFVAEDHWALDDDVADVPRLVEVRVRAADADGL